jgi:hypothetical protein
MIQHKLCAMIVKNYMDIKDYNKIQINYTTRRDKDDNVLDRNVMINIRTDSVEEGFSLYSDLKQKLNGQLDSDESHKQGEITYQSENDKCPSCGRNLVQRKGKNGDMFWGCSGYPGCKFTKTR